VEQSGEYRIAAARATVWQGLNDPDVLARCIDGCQSMTKTSNEQFDAVVKVKIGPVSATFQAQLVLSEIQPPSSYVLTASVKGGAAGFGKGAAEVSLEDDGDATLLRYAVNANVGGKLAQIGSRLIDAAARKMADDFFTEFGREVSGQEPEETGPAHTKQQAEQEPNSTTAGQWKIWAVVFGALILALILAF
jgi:carbon monoxide dehydrogenase subunit G